MDPPTLSKLFGAFCNALAISLFIFEKVGFCNGLQCNGGSSIKVTIYDNVGIVKKNLKMHYFFCIIQYTAVTVAN
jgi:hypothetical protein